MNPQDLETKCDICFNKTSEHSPLLCLKHLDEINRRNFRGFFQQCPDCILEALNCCCSHPQEQFETQDYLDAHIKVLKNELKHLDESSLAPEELRRDKHERKLNEKTYLKELTNSFNLLGTKPFGDEQC